MPLTPEQLEAVRALVTAEPGLGRPAIAERLQLSEHLVRQALRELGHRAPAGRKPAPPPSKFRPSAWGGEFLEALANALDQRAGGGHGLAPEEVVELLEEVRRRTEG